MIDMTVECPSCRSLFFSFDDTNPDEFECFNPECGMIKHKDLEKVEDEGKADWERSYSMGYKCRKCGMRQREAQFKKYRNEECLSKAADEYIACVEKEFKYQINFRRGKKEIERMILYVMDPKRNKVLLSDMLTEFFPTIWGWILQAPDMKDVKHVIWEPVKGTVNDKIGNEINKGLKSLRKIKIKF